MGSSVLDPKPLLSDIRKELQKSYLSMSTDLRKIDNELKFMKGLVHKAYMLTVDTRYKSGFERVESSYKTFLNGAKNLKVTLKNITAFISGFFFCTRFCRTGQAEGLRCIEF